MLSSDESNETFRGSFLAARAPRRSTTAGAAAAHENAEQEQQEEAQKQQEEREEKPTVIACYGDMGTVMPLGFAVFRQLLVSHERSPFDLVFHCGDVSYAGTDTEVAPLNISRTDEWEWIWDLFGEQIEPLASRVPYMVGVGNHEAWYNFTAFRHRFVMPSGRSRGEGNFWYSFDAGHVHMLSFSTEHSLHRLRRRR